MSDPNHGQQPGPDTRRAAERPDEAPGSVYDERRHADDLRRAGTLPPSSVDAPARDWREAWRAAREGGPPLTPPGPPGPHAPPGRAGAPVPATPVSAPPVARPPSGHPPASPAPQAWHGPTGGQPPAAAPGGHRPDHVVRPGSGAPDAPPPPTVVADGPVGPARPPRPARPPADPAQWLPVGHGAAAPVHESTPGRPALPGTDPSATTPAMAVGAALPGGPSTGPLPVPTGESSARGFKAALADGLAKARAMTTAATSAVRTSVAAPAPPGPATPAGPDGSTDAPGHNGDGWAAHPSAAPGSAGVASPPDVGLEPTLAPFAEPTAAQGGPVMAAGLAGTAVAAGGPVSVAAGAAAGLAGAATDSLAATSSATATSATSTMGAAPTTTLPPVATPPAGRPPDRPRMSRRPAAPARRGGGLRRAHLKLTRIDPWTVMKVSFMLSIAFGIMTIVSVFVIWSMLDTAGVFTAISDSVNSVTGDTEGSGVDIMAWVALDRVLGFATLLAVVDVVLITALSTLFAFLYNLASTLLGGVEVTLVEDHR